jgi:hypothetical protein
MKTIAFLGLILVALAATVLRAADTQPATASRPASQPALQAIRYERTGGFAGTNDVIEITPAGAVVLQGKLMGNGKGQLTAEQIAALAPLFADWKSLKASYPAPAGSADGFNIKIRYGTTEVSASEMNASLPATFKAARQALEKIAQDIKK